MKTLMSLRVAVPPSFRTTTRNSSLKLLSRLFAVFGMVMILAVSGWGATTFSIANNSKSENSGPLNLVVTLKNISCDSSTHQYTVQYATGGSGDTATAGSDYTSVGGATLTFNIGIKSGGSCAITNGSGGSLGTAGNNGDVTQNASVTIINDTLYEADETLTVTLSNPVNATLGTPSSATGTITNDDTAPTVSIASNSTSEGDSGIKTLSFTVTQSAVSGLNTTVNYSTSDGTATAGSDYVAVTNGTVTIPAGSMSGTAAVTINGDTTLESNESFSVTLSNPVNATLGTPFSVTGMIINDDSIPTLSVANVSQAEGSTGGYTQMIFTATLSNPSSAEANVTYATANGTADSGYVGADFTSQGGTLTFAAGETTKTISIPIFGDTNVEPDQNFTINFTTPNGLSITTASATGTILNDDADVPNITIADQSINEGNSGTTNMTFTVTVTNMKATNVTVNYTTSDGTALAGSDYNTTSGTVTFTPSGSTTQTITVPIIGDTIVELTEQFYVILSNPTGSAVISDNNATGTITDNDTSATCSPYIGQMMINEYNFTPSVVDEQGHLIPQSGNFVELKVIGQTLRDAIINDSHFIDNWTLEIYNKANTPNVAHGSLYLANKDALCDFALTGYLVYVFPSNVMAEGPATLVVKDRSGRAVDILYYGNSSIMYTPSACTFVYDTNMTESTNQNKDVFRVPDGTGDWTDNGNGANSGATRCTNPGGGFVGIHTIFDAFDYKASVSNLDIGRPITTKIASKDISLTAISTDSTHTVLANSVKVSPWLARKSGNNYYLVQLLHEVDFTHHSSEAMEVFQRINAGKDHVIAFKYCDNNGSYRDWDTCWVMGPTVQQKLAISWDNFAIRPDRLLINSSHIDMPNLLRSAEDYNATINAYNYNTTINTQDYNVTDANSTYSMTTTKYMKNNDINASMAGISTFAANGFDMANGLSVKFGITGNEVAGLAFSDVGKVNIRMEDRVWSAVDIKFNDTLGDCSVTGAYICGDTNVTFIPHHFDFNELNITNNNGNPGSFTYIANEVGQMGGRIHTQMRALNKIGNVTQNFASSPMWENNVTVVPVVTKSTYLYPDANETNIINLPIGFAIGVKTLVWNESNASQYLRFNFRRDVNQTVDPFDVNGSDLNISMTSHYIDGSNDANITGSRLSTVAPAFGSSKFVYGRIIPRDIRIFGAGIPFTANGWYEVYNTPVINTLSLPSSRNDAVWYVNVPHSDAVNGDGDANVTVVITGVNPTNTTAIGGVETYSFTSGLALGGYKAHILTAPWLWYGVNASPYLDPNGPAQAGADNLDCLTHPCFNINIVPPAGATGSAKSTNEGTKGSKKTNTGGGAWHSTSDYAPAIR